MSDDRPIGVFDSGVGGLTVLQAMQERLPHESTVYLGDLARCPYGTRPQSQVREFALQDADLLAAQDIKLLVIACNTATAAAFEEVRDRFPFPVIGVVEPGAAAAVDLSRTGRIGVVATDSTARSGAYRRAILDKRPEAAVLERSASWLVEVIETGPASRSDVARRLLPVLTELRREGIDVLILGCTHFPLVRDIFEDEIGPGIAVVDSAHTTALEVARVLNEYELEASAPARHRLLVSGPADAFEVRARAMFHWSPVIETIDFAMGSRAER